MKMFAVPFLVYSVSYLRGFPGSAGRGARVSPISWVDISSTHTWGHWESYGCLETAKMSSMWQTKAASCSGGIHHSFFCQGLSSFFLMSGEWSHGTRSRRYPTLGRPKTAKQAPFSCPECGPRHHIPVPVLVP